MAWCQLCGWRERTPLELNAPNYLLYLRFRERAISVGIEALERMRHQFHWRGAILVLQHADNLLDAQNLQMPE